MYVDAPNVLVPADVKVFGEEDNLKTESDESTATARGWWRTNPERTSSVGLDKSLEVLRDLLRGSRFDVSGSLPVRAARADFTMRVGCVGIQVRDGARMRMLVVNSISLLRILVREQRWLRCS